MDERQVLAEGRPVPVQFGADEGLLADHDDLGDALQFADALRSLDAPLDRLGRGEIAAHDIDRYAHAYPLRPLAEA